MVEEYMSQKFRLNNTEERRNNFVEEIEQRRLMGKKHKKVCMALNYSENFLSLASAVTGCNSNSAFSSLISIPIEIMSFVIGLEICAKTAVLLLLAKFKLNNIEGLNFQSLINPYICDDEFVLIHNVLKRIWQY